MKFERLIGRLGVALSLAVSSLFAPSIALADFPPVSDFPNTGFYQARFLRDKHDVAVMELTGNYDRNTAESKPNVEPRTVVAKEFYRTHPDHYDFVVVFSNFEFDTGDATAFHLGVQNKIKGLGKPEFDYTAMFGSSGKLKGYIDMAALSRYVTNPYDTRFDVVLQVFAHEFLHQWGANVHVRAPDGSLSTALLGKDGAHWSFLLNSGASVEYGNQWRDNGDGTFTSVAGRQFYSPLDLYLMGMYRKEEVPSFFLIENPDIDKTRLPLNDVTLTGLRKNLSIDDVTAAEGPRVPDADHAQKEFRLGFVLLSRAGAAATDQQIAAVNNIRKAIDTRIEVLTGGRALAHSYIETKTAAGDPVVDPRSGEPRTGGANLVDGMTWLRGKQASDGKWTDNAFTAVRDTTVVFDTLADFDGAAFVGRQRALDWLTAQGTSNTDYLARRLRALSRAGVDPADEAPRLLALQNSDGGWGVAPGYQSNPLDTALVMQALRPFEATIANGKLDGAAAFLAARQNADGGWGNLIGGVSRTSVSATVLQALNGRAAPADLNPKAVAFLAVRQNADGGFGDSPSTVHDTANVVLALLTQNALGNIRAGDATSYVSSAQHTDGSWDESVYATALALRLLKSSGMFNWALTDLKAAPDSPLDGQQTVLSFKVSNNGTTAAPAGIVRVFDGDPAAAGVQIGPDINVPGLPVGDSIDLKLLWNTFEKAGSHSIFAIVDPENNTQESSKVDNRAQLKVVVRDAPTPIELLVNVTDITVNPARPSKLPSVFAISAMVSNIGKTDANAVRIVLREGEGATAKIVDEKILNLLGRTQQVVNFSATLTRTGATKYTVVIDPDGLVSELDKSNNVASVTVETSSALDLEVREAEATIVRTPVYNGSDAVFKVKIRNTGTQDSPPFKARYSVSNGVKTVEVATRTFQLVGGAATDQEVIWRTEFAGDLTFKVELDPDGILSESDKTNNSVSVPFKVVDATGVNLAVSFKDFVANPSPALESKELVLSQIVRNTGNVAASDIEVAFYDGDPAAGRMIGAVQKIAALASGESAVVSVTWPRYPDAEDHLLFFVADPAAKQAEITRDDNSAFVVVSALSMVDLAISSGDMTVLPQSPKPGEAINLSVKVSNLGKQAASNVVVRAFDGDPAQGGKQVGADQTIAAFAGLSSQTLSFVFPASDTSANRPMAVVVDPDNTIEEKSKDNNIARRDLVVQDGDFFVTNRFFSPNGDGVKDDTTLGFRLKSVNDVTVDVLNRRGKVVRSYGGDTLKNIQSGSVTWDGLNQRGSVVQDGDYRLRVLGKDGATLGEAMVNLDTNRSSIIDAVDTPFEQFTNLSCELNNARWPDSLKITADEERVYLFNSQDWNSVKNFPQTHFRELANTADLTALLSAGMLQGDGWAGHFSMSLNGEKIALTRYVQPVNGAGYRDQLWVMDGDGRNMKIVRDVPAGTFQNIERSSNLTGDGGGFVVGSGYQLQMIPTDGVSAETVLMDTRDSDIGGGNIGEIQFSPDRNLALVEIDNEGPSYYLVDLRTGRRRRMPGDLPQNTHFQILSWAPNSKLFAMGGMLSGLQANGAGSNDARFYVLDEEFNVVNTFQTNVGSGTQDYYGGAVGSLDWASNSAEFVFGHSFCHGECSVGEGARLDGVQAAAVSAGLAGAQHVLMRADLITGALEAIETTRVQTNYAGNIPSTYLWAPNERTILRSRSNDCNRWSGDSCIDAISLDDDNKIRQLFQNWHGAPDVIASPYEGGMELQGFLPSGRKLMFSSSRAAADTASSCYQTGPDQYNFGTLLNMTVDLRPLRSAAVGGLMLRGTAADQNFSRYAIEYAPVATPNDWKIVTPASDVPVVDNVFTNWVPPAFGNYFLRLSVEDLAGNKRQQIRRVSWSDTPSITDVYKDIEFISPNGDAVQDVMKLHYRVLEPVHLEFNVYGKDDVLFRSVARDHFSVGQEAFFNWDGRDERGRVVPDGQYRIKVQDYEFYVTVDNTPPSADFSMRNAYGFEFDMFHQKIVAYAAALSWNTDDINYAKMAIERGQGETPSDWLEVGRYPSLAKSGGLSLAPDQFVGMQYRIKIADKAGNQTSAGAPLGDQQVFLLGYANHRRNNPPKDNTWIGALNALYADVQSSSNGEAQTVDGLPRLVTLVAGNPTRLQFAETVRKPLAKVILQFREVAPTEHNLPVSSLNASGWNEVLIPDFVKYDRSKDDYVSVGNRAPEDSFELLWDMQGIKAQTDYVVRIKVVDEDSGEFFAMSPYIFQLKNALTITGIVDNRSDSLSVNALVLWDEPVAKIDLLISSIDDPRFATERSIHTVFAPAGSYNHYLGTELLKELDLRLCGHYAIRLKGMLASGLSIYSGPADIPTRCLGADWIVAPDTAQSCDATPTSKMNVRLRPYSNDGRKLTQLLFGQISEGGREDILNNWNDVQSDREYSFIFDTKNLADGNTPYFARVINEDGKRETVAIPIQIAHKAPTARITYPADGQKLCGIKVPNPFDPSKLVSVVPIEAAVVSDSNVSYGLEYAIGTNPSEWKTFSPKGERQDPTGFHDLRRDWSRFESPVCNPYSADCVDFYPIQWSSDRFAQRENFQGAAAKSGLAGRLGLYESIDGEVSVRLRAFNAAGHQLCTPAVTFDFDNSVRVHASSIDRRIFSPKAEQSPNSVTLLISPDEAVTVDVQVFPATLDDTGHAVAGSTAIRSLAQGQIVSPGEFSYEWDGNADGNVLAPDGWYVLRVTYTDGCGNTLSHEHAVELDATPPAVVLKTPTRDAKIGLIVPVIGSIRDIHFQSFAIQYALPGSPDTWVPLFNGATQTPAETSEQELTNWNTLGLSGPVTLRVVALDIVANKTVVEVPLEITTRTDLISYLESVPDIFSPNGDKKHDTISIRYGLLNPAKATLEILRGGPGGVVVQTLMKDEAVAAGASTKVWDGINSNGQVEPDGLLVAKLTVTSVGDVIFKQDESAQFTLDNTAPKVVINYPKADFVTPKGAVTFSATDLHLDTYKAYFAANPAGGNWQLVADGISEQTAGFVTSLEGLAEGKYGVKVVATDRAENATEVIKLFEVDNTPPKVALTLPLADSYLSAKKGVVNIAGTVEEKNLAGYKLRFGQGTPSASFSDLASGNALPLPATLKEWDISQVADGAYTLWLSADDLAGQNGQARVNVVIDNTPPTAVIVLPATGGYVKLATDITGTAADDNFKEYKLEIAPGSKATANRWSLLAPGAAAVNGGVLLKWQALPPDGQQTLKLTVTDKAGNVSEAFSEIVIDTLAPSAPLNLAATLESRKDARLTWTANSDPDLAGYAVFRNGTRINQNLLTDASYLDAALASGSYAYTVKAIDKAGWESAVSNSVSIVVSLSGPTAQIFSPGRGSLVSSLLDIKGTANAASDFKEYRLYVGAGTNPSSWQLLRRSPVPTVADILGSWNTLGIPENSVQTLKLEAEDISGAIATDTVTISVDNTPPAAATQLKATANGADVTLTWTASTSADVAGYILFRDERVANAQGVVIGSLKPYLIVPSNYLDLKVADGIHTYVVQAMDKAENMSDPSNAVSVTIDTRAPHATIVKPLAGAKIGRSTSISATSPDTDIATVQFQYMPAAGGAWTNLGAAVTKLPYAVTWDTSALAYGDYLVQAVATDKTSHTDPAPTSIKLTYADLQAPDVVTDLKGKVKGGDVTLTWSNNAADLAGYLLDRVDPDGNVVSRSVASDPAVTFVDPALPDGRYTYRVYAIDTANNKNLPSDDLSVLIYTPAVVQPYTPTSSAVFTFKGQGQVNSKISLVGTDDHAVATTAEFDPAADGSFTRADLPLVLGDNRYELTQTDVDGNISKTATFHVKRADPPAKPSGLKADINGSNITLSWTANGETNLLGYRVLRDAQDDAQPADGATASASSYRTGNGQSDAMPQLAIDGDNTTGWLPDTTQEAKGQWLQLEYPAASTFSKLKLVWDASGIVKDYDIEAWDGEVWVPLAAIRDNRAALVETILDLPYRTNMVRIKLVDTRGIAPNLAEIQSSSLPQQADTSLTIATQTSLQTFKVYAENSYGMFSEPATIKQGETDTTPPNAVTLLATVGGSDVTLTWNASTSTDVQHYEIFRDGTLIDTLEATILTTDDIVPNGTYHYTVKAVDAAANKSVDSNVATAVVNVALPDAPINLQVSTAASGGALVLNWTRPATGPNPAGYRVTRSLTAGGPYALIADWLFGTNYLDVGLRKGVQYFYIVSTLDDAGNAGTGSNEASGTLPVSTALATPVIYAPTVSGTPIATRNPFADIVGYAQPGTDVTLLRGDALLGTSAVPNGNLRASISVQNGFSGFDASDDGRRLLSIGGTLDVVEIDTGSSKSVPGTSAPLGARWSHDGQTIAIVQRSSGADSALYVYQDSAQAPVQTSDLSIASDALAWSPDDAKLAVLGNSLAGKGGLWLVDRMTQENRLLVEAPTEQFGNTLRWSPDGKYVAFVRNDAVRIATVSDGSVVAVDEARHSSLPSWSFDGARLIYQFVEANDYAQVGEYAVANGSTVALSNGQFGFYAPHELPLNGDYLDNEAGQLVQRAHDGSFKALVTNENWDDNVQTTPSGYVFYRSSDSAITRLSPAGTFRFPLTHLNTGANEFSVYATDNANNQSPRSDAINVTLGDALQSDLAVDAADIAVLPDAAVAGGTTRVSAVVKNIGGAAAMNFDAVITVTDVQGKTTPLASKTIALLGAGGSITLAADWTPLNAGEYSIAVTADAAGSVDESSKANNSAVRAISVAAPALPIALQVTAPQVGRALLLNWETPLSGNPAAYSIKRALTAGGPYQLITDAVTGVSYLDSGLNNGVTYFYVVTALDAGGRLITDSLEAWGIPQDKLAPTVPLILGPTVSGKPITVSDPFTDIVGYAEPGSNVALLRNNSVLNLGVASTDVTTKDITVQSNPSAFHVSDDGRRLVSAGNAMEIIEIETGAITVVPDVADVRAAQWSHDGQSIAFIKFDQDVGSDTLYVYNDSDKTTVKTSGLNVPRNVVAWSYDSAKIAVVGFDSNGKNGVWLVDRVTQENRLLVEAPWWQFDDSVSWSPDGEYIALVRNSAVQVIKTSDGSTVFTHKNSDSSFPYNYSGLPSWSFDGTRLIYQFYGTGYSYQIGEFSLQSGTARALSDPRDYRYSPHWIGTNNDFVDYENGLAVLRAYDGTAKETLAGGSYDPNRTFSTPSGYLVYQRESNVIARVAPTGTFRFPHTHLNSGINDFSAYAADSVNNRSATSDSIRITLANATLPDLAAGESDIIVLPSAPLVGEQTRLTATVRNSGTATAKDFDVAITARDPHGAITTLTSTTIAELAAGESSVIALNWTPAQAGQYTIALALDSSASVAESNEANNVGVRTINVAAGALPVVSATTDAKLYSANSTLSGNVKVSNAGPLFSGTVTIRIEDKDGYPVEQLPSVSVIDMAFGQSAEYPVSWNTGAVLAGDYRLAVELRDVKGSSISTGNAAFSIGSVRQINAALVVDRTQYKNQQNANIAGTVELVSANASLTDAVGLIQVVNGNGDILSESSQALGTLLPGASAMVNAVWNTGSSPAGTYRAKLTVSSGGTPIAAAETSFEVVTEIVAQLSGNLTLSGAAVANGDRLTASYVLQNTGNIALTALPVVVTVVDPDNQAVVATSRGSADIALGGSAQGQAQFDLVNWPLKPLQAVLSAELGGNTIVLQRTTLRVIDRIPPVVTFVSPVQAAMLSGIETPVVVKAIDRESHVASVEYSIGGSPWKPFALQSLSEGLYNVKLSGVEDGPHQVLARATDAFSNVSDVVTLDVIIDNTPPLIVVAGVIDGSRYISDVTPLVTVSDANLKSSVVTLDGLAFASGAAVSAGGAHTLQIDAEDKAGNKSSRTVKFVVGKPPTATILTPVNGALVRAAFTLTGSAGSLTASIARVEYQIDGAAWADMQAVPSTAGQYQVSIGNLVDGAHKAALRATDTDGLVSSVVLLDFAVDGTPPVIAITGVTEGATYAADVAASISVTDVNLKSSTASLNGQAYVSGATIHAEGSYELLVQAEDKAGNTATATRKLTIDRTPPVVTPGAPAVNSTLRELKTVQATATDALSAVVLVEYRIDAGAFKPMVLQAGTPNLYGDSVVSVLTDGPHTVAFRATDAAGNIAAPIEVPFSIDATPPVITVAGVVDGQRFTGDVTATVTVADINLSSSQILLDGVPYVSGTAINKVGVHTLQIDAEDKAGNKSSKTVQFQIAHPAPTVAITAPANGALLRTPFVLAGSAASAASSIAKVEYQLDGGTWVEAAAIAGKPGQYQSTIAVVADGAHKAVLRATDAEAQVTSSAALDFVVDNTAPVIAVTGIVNGAVYTSPVTPVITVTDAHAVTTTILLDGVSFASGQTVSKTGAHQLVVTASDELGNKSELTLSFTINAKLAGSLAASPKPVPLGDAVVLAAVVTNQGTALTGVQYQVTITDVVTKRVVQQFNDSGDLAANGTYQRSYSWITAGVAGASFKATLTAKVGADASTELSSDTFTLGESRVKLTGAVSVAPKEVEVGANAVVTQQVVNGGGALSGVKVELTVLNVKTNAVAYQNTDTIDLAANATWSVDRSWKVAGPDGTGYVAKLAATADGKSFALGESEFAAISPHPKLDLSYGPAYPQRILILSQCKRSANASLGQCGAKPIQIDDAGKVAKCDDDRAKAVDSYLTSIGISHKVVTSESDFAREIKSGGYSGYWVSGGGTKLRQPLQTELKAGLLLGEALLADGLHDVRESDRALKELLGIHYRGKFASGKAPKLTMLGDLYRAGELQVLGDVLIIDTLSGGKVQAEFRGSAPHGDDDDDDEREDDDEQDKGGDGACGDDQSKVENEQKNSNSSDSGHACHADDGDNGGAASSQVQAGIVSGVYGPGHTLFFAFDWVNTFTAQTKETRWIEIGHDSFNWLQPVAVDATGAMIAGDVVTRTSRLRNLGQDVVLTITAELPVGATALLADPSAQIQAQPGGDIVTWQLNLAAGAERNLNLQLRLPKQEGNYSVRYTVKSVIDGKATLFGTDTVPLPVAGLATLTTKAKDAIGALTVTAGKNAAAKADALRWIGRAEQASGARNDAEALRDLVMVQSRLDSISGIDLTASQRALARMIRAVERRM